jgi:hypothetical protein
MQPSNIATVDQGCDEIGSVMAGIAEPASNIVFLRLKRSLEISWHSRPTGAIRFYEGTLMRNRNRLSIVFALASISYSFEVLQVAFAGEVLITEQEARLPPAKNEKPDSRGITRGPRIALVSASAVHSPFRLQFKFQSYGGAKIDTESLRVVLLKTPDVDLTTRVRPFVQAEGIDMPAAEAPVGQYDIRVELKDTAGRVVAKTFELKVDP